MPLLQYLNTLCLRVAYIPDNDEKENNLKHKANVVRRCLISFWIYRLYGVSGDYETPLLKLNVHISKSKMLLIP